MTGLFDKQEREKELRDFDAVWPGNNPQAIIDDFRDAHKEALGREAPAVTQKDGVYTVHFIGAVGSHEYTAKQVMIATFCLKTGATLAVKP